MPHNNTAPPVRMVMARLVTDDYTLRGGAPPDNQGRGGRQLVSQQGNVERQGGRVVIRSPFEIPPSQAEEGARHAAERAGAPCGVLGPASGGQPEQELLGQGRRGQERRRQQSAQDQPRLEQAVHEDATGL